MTTAKVDPGKTPRFAHLPPRCIDPARVTTIASWMHRTLIGCCLALLPVLATAQDMLTIHGNPAVPDGELIQISPATAKWNDQITVTVRVSRSTERNAYGGGTYRSHSSLAVIDCTSQSGWYAHMRYYDQPMWRGTVVNARNYQPGEAPVAFRDIPGEAERLVRAACLLQQR